MARQSSRGLDEIFRALSDPTRRAILRRLSRGERTIGELSAPFDISLAAVSKHLKALEKDGLITRTVKGREHHCRPNPTTLARAHPWLSYYERFWSERLDAPEKLVGRARRN